MTNRKSTTRNLPGNLKESSNRGRTTSLEDLGETETGSGLGSSCTAFVTSS